MNKIDWDFIENNFYTVRNNDHPGKIYCKLLSQFSQKEVTGEFIELYSSKIKGLNNEVAATYFCSAYGWFLSSLQYVMSVLDTTYDALLENIEVQLYFDKEHNYYGICFRVLDKEEMSYTDCRENWRKVTLEQVYSMNVVPLVNFLHEASSVKKRDLYGQLAIGLYNGHDMNVTLAETNEQKEFVQKDFHFLTKELGKDVFQLPKNPLDIPFQMIESPREEGVMIRMKPSCCLYYQTEGAKTKCYGCPRMSEEDRMERKKEIQASL